MRKRNCPGCKCCIVPGTTVSWNSSGSSWTGNTTIGADAVTGDGTEASPVYSGSLTGTNITITSIGALGAGAEIVGIDADNHGWVVQRSNGEVWTLNRNGADPQQLFTTSADIAGEELSNFKWHEKWGVGVGRDESNNLFSVDSNGDYIISPFSGEATFCTDPAGDIYTVKNFGGSTFNRVAKNGSQHARGITSTAFGDTGNMGFHDGTNLYIFGQPSGSAPSETNGIYLVNDLSTMASLTTSWAGIFTGTVSTRSYNYYDAKHRRVRFAGNLGGDSIYFKMRINGTGLIVYNKVSSPTNEAIWMAP